MKSGLREVISQIGGVWEQAPTLPVTAAELEMEMKD
jgi:hypothetical protein